MRVRLSVVLVPALLAAACGGDGGTVFSTSSAPGGTGTTVVASSSTSSIGQTTTATTESVTTTSSGGTTSTVVDLSYAWERVPRESVLYGPGKQAMAAVAAGGPGLVAVGWDLSSGDADASVWTSADGLVWEQIVVPAPGNQYMTAVTPGGPGLVAVGHEQAGAGQVAAVWTSLDGSAWSRVPHDDAAFGGADYQEMRGVTAGGPGLVAVGIGNPGGDDSAVVWVSTDGITWARVDAPAVLGGPGGQAMYAVAAAGPGLVAVGSDYLGGLLDAAVWTSPDGTAWTRVIDTTGALGGDNIQSMASVAVAGPGLVAAGFDVASGNPDAAVWTSADGVTWSRIAHDAALFGGSGVQEMLGVAAGGPGVVAVGSDESGPAGDAAVWVSGDGSVWSRVSAGTVLGGPLHQKAYGVAAGGPGVVVVGLERNPDGGAQQAAVWVGHTAE